MSKRFLKIAVVYMMLGALIGMAMGISQNFAYIPVHAHVLLLGWVSMALAGLIYHLHPQASTTRLAAWHFWLHNIGLPIFMISLAIYLSGVVQAGPFIAVGAATVVVGIALFVLNVLRRV